MNKGGNMSRLTLCLIWIVLGFLTVKSVMKNLGEIQKNIDVPNPVLKKFGIDSNVQGTPNENRSK